MDIIEQLNKVEDLELQDLLTHAVRYTMTHNLIASKAAAAKDNPQANQAAGIHKDTAFILDALVKRVLADNLPVEAPVKPAKRNVKAKDKE
jgi:hypothetical protein